MCQDHLHPSIVDGALQTVIGLAGAQPGALHLPFAVDEVEILQPLTETCYVYVEPAAAENAASPEMRRFNIRLLGENGDVRVRLNNFYVRALRNTPASAGDEADAVGTEHTT